MMFFSLFWTRQRGFVELNLGNPILCRCHANLLLNNLNHVINHKEIQIKREKDG
jgi:hypothetical protein